MLTTILALFVLTVSGYPDQSTHPLIQIPSSDSTVSVKVLNPATGGGLPGSEFLDPVINGTIFSRLPFFSFLIEHTAEDGEIERLLFDGGIRKDIENSVPSTVEAVNSMGFSYTNDTDVPDLLVEGGIPLSSISTVIWSHPHFDHIGDASLFPKQVNVTVGPGFTDAFLPAWPENPDSPLNPEAVEGRTYVELNFTSELQIDEFDAIDWFGDGSFYVLHTPGHAIGHISGFARTSPGTFILLGGDVGHQAGEIRPSKYDPLPREIKPSPFKYLGPKCVGEFAINVHPQHSRQEPYMRPAEGPFTFNRTEMIETLDVVSKFDADPRIFTIIAHDQTVADAIDLFPQSINDWVNKGWKKSTRWAFLKEFEVS